MTAVPRKFDAIIIGCGQAGPSLAGRLSAARMTVALIERHAHELAAVLLEPVCGHWLAGVAAEQPFLEAFLLGKKNPSKAMPD